MATITKNLYVVQTQDKCQKRVVAASVAELAQKYDTTGNPIIALKLEQANVATAEIIQVAFTTFDAPDGAAVTTPDAFTVDEGQKVILTATVEDGYLFQGWYLNGVLLSADAVAEVTVNAPATAGQQVQFEARCVVGPST